MVEVCWGFGGGGKFSKVGGKNSSYGFACGRKKSHWVDRDTGKKELEVWGDGRNVSRNMGQAQISGGGFLRYWEVLWGRSFLLQMG